MTVINTYTSQDEASRASRFQTLCRRCILLLRARRARGQR